MAKKTGYIHLSISGGVFVTGCRYEIKINSNDILSKNPISGLIGANDIVGNKGIKRIDFRYDSGEVDVNKLIISYRLFIGELKVDEGTLNASSSSKAQIINSNVNQLRIRSTVEVTIDNREAKRKVNAQTCKYPDGAIQVAEYIVKEIQKNVRSSEAAKIKSQLSSIIAARKALGFYNWYMQVAPGKPWDHKPKIRDNSELKYLAVEKKLRPNSRNLSQSFFHKYKNYDYFYDVWSNIHYGYVGRYVGFDANTLLTGSYLQQFGKEAVDEVIKIKNGDKSIKDMELKADTKDDIIAMQIGIDLFENFYPATYVTEYLILKILDSTPSSDLPYSKQIHVCYQ
ncbi:polymorphic toxin type 44 domain-containing protein [Psychrobacter sp. JCM 18902]|uniref:polymorphic toxin type 44 domain-containing protein n=1 Tax=Psychrobacter sp. JCM 18902 TaxID=1298607 RepID=UPI0019180571|nr:polymorphic toxin type 44 domain-containing protein [Psychrobacter sp. JCM 18902]